MGSRGLSSLIGTFSGTPYTAQVEEKTKFFTPASTAVFSRVSAHSTLLWKYLRGFSTDSPT